MVLATVAAETTSPPGEPAPPEWDFMQAVRYYYEIAWPMIKSTLIKPMKPLDFSSKQHIFDGTFVCRIICDAISGASRARGRLIRQGDDPACAGLWKSHARYLLEHIKHLNHCISTGAERAAFWDFTAIIDFDFMVEGFMWQAHMNGFFAYVEHIGGIASVMEKRPGNLMSGIMYHVFQSNTTSPARQQVVGCYSYTDAQLRDAFGAVVDLSSPCPVELVLRIIEITRLRFEIATGLTLEAQVTRRAPILFREIDDFDMKAWVEGCNFATADLGIKYGEIYRLSIRLYGILVLPPSAVLAAYSDGSEDQRCRTLLRRRLLQLIRELYPTVNDTFAFQWPLVVAGVAAATGHDAVEDQDYIGRSLYGIWQKPLSDCSTFKLLVKLRAFWQSGQTEWEDCFYEPTPC